MGIGPSLQAFEEVFPTLPYDSFTPSGMYFKYSPRTIQLVYLQPHPRQILVLI